MHNLFAVNKMDYCRGERPDVECILCEVINKTGNVTDLEIYRNKLFIVCLNLFPYNPGHLLVAPIRHIEDLRDFTAEEAVEMHAMLELSLAVLDDIYKPSGFNIGYNLGNASGASIQHLHCHIVPRYDRELGFIDIIGGSKIIVEDPETTKRELTKAFNDQE